MKTLIEHVESLSKYSDDSPEIILWSILHNNRVMDDDSLLAYDIEHYPSGNEFNLMWGDGDGNKIEEWAMTIAKQYNCVRMYVTTKRWKPFARRFHAKPVAVILERRLDNGQ